MRYTHDCCYIKTEIVFMTEKPSKYGSQSSYFVEVPGGLMTVNGSFYHTDSQGIEQLIPGLLEKYSLTDLLKEADGWIWAHFYLGYYALLFGVVQSAWLGPVLMIVVGIAIYLLRPALTGTSIGRVIVFLANDPVCYFVTVVALVWLGFYMLLTQMWIGLAGFLILRMWLVVAKGGLKNDFPSRNDRILYFVLQKKALETGLQSLEIEEIQNNLIYYHNYGKKRKSGPP